VGKKNSKKRPDGIPGKIVGPMIKEERGERKLPKKVDENWSRGHLPGREYPFKNISLGRSVRSLVAENRVRISVV